MYLLFFFLPFFISCFCFFFSNFLSSKIIPYFVTFFIFLNFLISIFIFWENTLLENVCILELNNFYWIQLDLLKVKWCFIFDALSSTMLLIVSFISFLVHLYSIEYMQDDPHIVRFFIYLSLFTFFMIFLLISGNFVQLFFGWEGVGLTSFLLINFWYTRVNANKAALKAMLVNRIGDCGLLFAIFLFFLILGSVDLYTIFSLIPYTLNLKLCFFGFDFFWLDFVSFFLFLGVSAKSAQFGLHVWLPDAMEGPTPVSALLHAATMVTAGIYLIIRCSYIFEYSSFILFLFCFFGAVTAFFAALTACFQIDLKKIIAYSTCSQLGYMVLACGLSLYSLSLFHFFNHSFFKALLFLGAGAIIHSLNDYQESYRMGNLYILLPFTTQIMLIGIVSLISLPFTNGFYSKDFIIEILNTSYYLNNYLINWLIIFATVFTVFYNINMYKIVFYEDENFNLSTLLKINEPGFKIIFVCFTLSILSIFVGFFFKDLFIGFGTIVWKNSIFILPENVNAYEVEFFYVFWKILFLFFILCIFYLLFIGLENFFLYITPKINETFFSNLSLDFFSLNWFYDSFINFFLKYFFFPICLNSLKILDKGFFEFFGPYGIYLNFIFFLRKFRFFNLGYLNLFFFFIFIILILFVLFFFMLENLFLVLFLLFFSFYLLLNKSK